MADEIQGGLSIPVKETTKGALVPSGTMSLGPEENAKLLASMQKIIDERQSPLNLFMSGLKDASAAGSGGRAGPTAAIQMRDEQKAKEAAELFKMRTDMAGLRSAQTQQELLKKQYESVNPPEGAAATGTTAGTSPIPGLSIEQFKTIKNDPYVQSQLETLAPNDYAGKLAIIRDAAKTEFGAAAKGRYEAAGNKQEPYTIPGIGKNGGDGTVMMTSNEKIIFDNTRTLPDGTFVPKTTTVTKATTTTPSTINDAVFSDPSISIISAKRTPEKGQELWDTSVKNGTPGVQPNGLPVAKPGTSPHETQPQGAVLDIDPKKLTRSGRTELAQKGYYQPLGIDSPHWERIPGSQSAATTAPTTAPTTTSAEPQLRDYPTKAAYDSAMKLYEEKQKIPVSAAAQEATTYATETGKDLAQLKKDTERAMATTAAADRVIKMADDPKLNKVMGWMHGGNTAATYLGAIPSFAAEVVGKGDKFEEKVKQLAWSGDKDLIAADERLSTDATQLGIEYTQQMFKGARLGIGLEKLGLKGKGVSPEFLPQVNKLYATIAKDGAEFEVKKNTAFEKWHNDDPLKTYGKFLATPEYEKMMKDERDLLISRYPGITVDVLDAPSDHKTTKSGVKYKVL